jgi:hypothetical protein
MLIDVETDKVETPSLGDKCSKFHATNDSYSTESIGGERDQSRSAAILMGAANAASLQPCPLVSQPQIWR